MSTTATAQPEWMFELYFYAGSPIPQTALDALLDHAIDWAEARQLQVGGGYGPLKPNREDDAQATTWHFNFGLCPNQDGLLIEEEHARLLFNEMKSEARARGFNFVGCYRPEESSLIPLDQRLAVIREARLRLAAMPERVIEAVGQLDRRHGADTLTAELVPLLEAMRWCEKHAAKTLKPRRFKGASGGAWLMGVRSEVRREPWGEVGVLAPSNYPLMLPGIQAAQAIAAGNRVAWKPAPGGEACAELLAEVFIEAGLPQGWLKVLPSTVEAGQQLANEADLLVVTGGYGTGQAVLRQRAELAKPTIVELSGSDAMVVLKSADANMAAQALGFGLRLNGGATCIAPRKVFIASTVFEQFMDALKPFVEGLPSAAVPESVVDRFNERAQAALRAGATLRHGDVPASSSMRPVVLDLSRADAEAAVALDDDLFLPWCCVDQFEDDALSIAHSMGGRYRLGVSIFGKPEEAHALVHALSTDGQLPGSVCVNDLVVPTADARLPFAPGGGRSGFGTTRGPEGLLAMTRPVSVSSRKGAFRPHYEVPLDRDVELFGHYLTASHGRSFGARLGGWLRVLQGLAKKGPPSR